MNILSRDRISMPKHDKKNGGGHGKNKSNNRPLGVWFHVSTVFSFYFLSIACLAQTPTIPPPPFMLDTNDYGKSWFVPPTGYRLFTWAPDANTNTDHYNVYFSRFDGHLKLIGQTPKDNCCYMLNMSNYWYGIFAITAVNSYGVESKPSFLQR